MDETPPVVTVKAAYSKHRRDDILPLRASTVAMLTGWCDESDRTDRNVPIFGTMPEKPGRVFHADLAKARAGWIDEAPHDKERERREKSSFLAYQADAGTVADSHALRHTFITNLARGGVHPKIAQGLARHSTITLTMDRYSHTVIGVLVDGLNALPELLPGQTGT